MFREIPEYSRFVATLLGWPVATTDSHSPFVSNLSILTGKAETPNIFLTQSHQVFGHPVCLVPTISIVIQRLPKQRHIQMLQSVLLNH